MLETPQSQKPFAAFGLLRRTPPSGVLIPSLFCVKIKVCILVAAKIASGRGEAGAWEDGEGVRVLESVPCVCEPAAAAKSLMCA